MRVLTEPITKGKASKSFFTAITIVVAKKVHDVEGQLTVQMF
jgi:hypothetical protein